MSPILKCNDNTDKPISNRVRDCIHANDKPLKYAESIRNMLQKHFNYLLNYYLNYSILNKGILQLFHYIACYITLIDLI